MLNVVVIVIISILSVAMNIYFFSGSDFIILNLLLLLLDLSV